MIDFKRMQSSSDAFFQQFYRLYSSAFPENERRSLQNLEKELNNPNFHAYVLMNKNSFVGIFNYWNFEKFIYIEHFAIEEKLRSQYLGTEALKSFLEKVNLPVILEVEMPNTDAAKRRIEFYHRHEFVELQNYYLQPPYESGGFPIPMQLMSNDYEFAKNNFETIKQTIYLEVYHFKPEV
ncbi:MAG TPA: GNAT family N-acetyltransferase [Paludibacteraceae bacterium]|jgi:hypothetical protein|nr:GNAT family N-acetyltransferase [Paludibacteraceae bacterium]HRT78251.1 GNAT family N-acetyltransferase [Paludibacteraceae bacterium]